MMSSARFVQSSKACCAARIARDRCARRQREPIMRRKPHVRQTPELLRYRARREAQEIVQYGWRPSKRSISQLKASTRDAIAYRILMRAWRGAGFKARTIQRLAGRT